jgi:uracil-DNA glycosylase family 4
MGSKYKKFEQKIINCQKCKRLLEYAKETKFSKRKKEFSIEQYWCKPVPSFGDLESEILIIGLAPGRHGAARTGRPFTGDYAGDILYRALYEIKFSNKKVSKNKNDELKLKNVRISNAVRCAPPQNKPNNNEILNCRPYLLEEIQLMPNLSYILTLGGLAHKQIISLLRLKQSNYKFSHNKTHNIPDLNWILINSYHPSRYNFNTKRLNYEMFLKVIKRITH